MADVGEPKTSDNCVQDSVNGHSADALKAKNSHLDKENLENGDIDTCKMPQVNGEVLEKTDTETLKSAKDVTVDSDEKNNCTENDESDGSKPVENKENKNSGKSDKKEPKLDVKMEDEKGSNSDDNVDEAENKVNAAKKGTKDIEDKSGSKILNEETSIEEISDTKAEESDATSEKDKNLQTTLNEKNADDVIEIRKETNDIVEEEDDESDIEMIEESDPLAISDADVKKANEENKKKKDSVVIVIDTNTLMKNQGTLNVSVANSTRSHSAKVHTTISPSVQTTPSTHASTLTSKSSTISTATTSIATNSATIQTAIQAITGGAPAIQGLQSAYLSAIQQVLLAQGSSSQGSNPQYLTQLQQYYNTLGALQDDAYVIEAPSFIVPYVMEGKPKENIKDFLTRINKEFEEHEKESKEDKGKSKEETKEVEVEGKKKEHENEVEEKGDEKMEVDKNEEKTKKDKETTKDDNEEKSDKEADEEAMEIDETEEDGKKIIKIDDVDGENEKERGKEDTSKEAKKEEVKDTKKNKLKKKADDEETSEDKDIEVVKEKEVETKMDEEIDQELKETTDKKVEKEKSKEDDKETKESDEDEIAIEKEIKRDDFSHLGRWESYYHSALGKFFLELGLSHTQEFIQSDLLRMQKRRLEKMKTTPARQEVVAVKLLEHQLGRTKQRNSHLYVPLKTCKFCSFKTESKLVMNRHLESPHMINYTYKCNFCEFETRGPQVILFHMEAEHNVRGRLERAPAFFQCPLCPYEDNNKSKMTRHSFSCSKKYKPEKNLDLADWEPPAKIPKLHRGRPNTLTKSFEPSKMPTILPKTIGGIGLGINLQNAMNSGGLIATAVGGGGVSSSSSLAGRGRGRPVGSYKNIPQAISGRNNSASLLYQGRAAANFLQSFPGVTTAQQLSIANQMLQSVQNKSSSNKSPQQPSISITPLPRSGPQTNVGKAGSPNTSRDGSSSRPSFVICEVCDGYIKDLEQLRNHMNLIHKVKIHPKMIFNRPPLNCQKCQQRFFTDQGLERHLLGTHGLVTSSMQEAANKGKDAGRCPICGKIYQWKLLNHVSRDHKMTLKPAHLSYKCTVCTATFNMYRLFENHVYSAHSVINKNKEAASSTSSASSGTIKKVSDAPLKINDEITIIPQPAGASKGLKADAKSSAKKADTPSVSKEITITKVGSGGGGGGGGSRSTRRSAAAGGGVEVISLDESPSKRQATEDLPKRRGRDAKRART